MNYEEKMASLKSKLQILNETTHDERLLVLGVFSKEENNKNEQTENEIKKPETMSPAEFNNFIKEIITLRTKLMTLLNEIEKIFEEIGIQQTRNFIEANKALCSNIPFARRIVYLIPSFLKEVIEKRRKRLEFENKTLTELIQVMNQKNQK